MDSNDILFNQYSLDFFAILRLFFIQLFGGDTTGAVSGGSGGSGIFSPDAIVGWISSAWTFFTILSWFVSFLLIFGIIYAYIRANNLGAVQDEILERQEKLYDELHGIKGENQRWDDVQKHIAEDNPNAWRLAIIEADIILDEALEKAGYAGLTIGDKLKSASPTQFTNLDKAWQAHRVRNEIAHNGSDFILTKKLAGETITQYQMALTELGAV